MGDFVTLTFGGRTYVFTVEDFYPRRAGTHWDPPDDAELTLANEVWIRHWSGDEDMDEVVTWDTAALDYARALAGGGLSVDLDDADEKLYVELTALYEARFYEDEARAERETYGDVDDAP